MQEEYDTMEGRKAMINWNITFNEDLQTWLTGDGTPPGNFAPSVGNYLRENWAAITDQDSNQSMKIRDIITKEVQLAGQQWAHYLKDPRGSITVNVKILIDSNTKGTYTQDDHLDEINSINGKHFSNTVSTSNVDKTTTKAIAEPFAAYKIRTGKAANGSRPDIKIYINPIFGRTNLNMI